MNRAFNKSIKLAFQMVHRIYVYVLYIHIEKMEKWKIKQTTHLHCHEHHAVDVDGGLEGGHSLGVGQPVQRALVDADQQVALLHKNCPASEKWDTKCRPRETNWPSDRK